jgi:hypothetical protein
VSRKLHSMSLTGLKVQLHESVGNGASSRNKVPHIKDKYKCDANLTKSKVVETIWGDVTLELHADVELDEANLVSESELESEIIQLDFKVKNIKIIRFKKSEKVYLEMDAWIESIEILDGAKDKSEVK